MNLPNGHGMTAAEHIAALDKPDLLVDSRVDQLAAVEAETSAFEGAHANDWQQLIYSYIPELRHHLTEEFMSEYRQVFASRVDLPDAEPVVTKRVGITHDSRRKLGDVYLPPTAPIALWRNGYEFHRQYCFGVGEASLDVAYETVRRLPTPSRDYDLDNSGGCDFAFTPREIHRSLSRLSDPEIGLPASLCVWPIARYEYVLMLKICNACIGALFEKYQIGRSAIEIPWLTDGGH